MSTDATDPKTVLLGSLLPDSATRAGNVAMAVIQDINRARSASIVADCAEVMAGNPQAREHLDEAYPLADGESAKSLKFWNAADLMALADLRLIIGNTGVIEDPGGPEAGARHGREAASVLIELAATLNDHDASTIGDVDWFGGAS